MFNDLKELTDTRYPGIPSNAAPSTLGDALLLELTNGEYLFAKAIAGRNSLSWLQVNDNGSVTLYVSTLGKDYLKPEVPLLLIRQGKDIYSTIRQAYQALMKNTEAADLKSRTAKEYFFINDEPDDVKVYEMEHPDVLLWAVWCIQQYAKMVSRDQCREKYGTLLQDIME